MKSKTFDLLRQEYKSFNIQRERLIRTSRDILRLSKQAIYAVHRTETARATQLLKKATMLKRTVDSSCKKTPQLLTVGAYADACEEYVEAQLFSAYALKKSTPTPKALGVDAEVFLGGLCDYTGEIARKAVNEVIAGNTSQAFEVKELVQSIYSELMRMDFRNSSLRQKFDRMKYTIERLEDLTLKLVLR